MKVLITKDYDCGNRQKKRNVNKMRFFLSGLVILLLSLNVSGQRKTEYLTRGLVAVNDTDHIFLSWRIFATDGDDVKFNLYRNDTLVNETPVTGISNYIDSNGTIASIYYLETVYSSGETEISTPVAVWQQQYVEIPLQTPTDYSPNDASVADLDGDGELEIVIKMEGTTKDNSQSGTTDPVYLHAYKMNGTLLWSINLGINIRGGAHYTQFLVYDLDEDGRAEVACKTAPGTTDATGEYLQDGPAADVDHTADYRNSSGYILDGPEYLTVFDGLTGKELSTVEYVPARGTLSTWGDTYGNRVDRFLACVAYLDTFPSLVMCRGYYDRTALTAWDFTDGELIMRWKFDTEDDQTNLKQYEGQGAHSISVGDVDDDGKDEIMYGALALDDDGSVLYNTNFYHGDATHLGDLIPGNPGLEFYMPSESAGTTHDGVTNPGVHVRNAATGEIIWSIASSGDIGRAMTADITADYEGYEFWASGGLGVYNSEGETISSDFPAINFAVWWDGDLLREMLDGTTVSKWGIGNLMVADGCYSNNGTKATPALSGDIIGDWREEVMLRTEDDAALRIYTTVEPTDYGIYTLLQDPQYREAIAWQNVGYNQPPHPGFYLASEMDSVPTPDIAVIEPDETVVTIVSPMNGFELGLGLDLDVIVHAVNISETNPIIIISNGETPIDTIKTAPYSIKIPDLTTGDYSFTASVYNYDGELVESDPVSFSVDEGYPEVSITSPGENTTFLPEESITISADASDTDGTVDSVAFYINNERITAFTETPYSIEIDNPGIGVYDIMAIAYDNDEKATESDIIGFEVGLISTFQEEETGFCGFYNGDGYIESNHTGYTGSGFANTDNHDTVGIYWAVNFPVSANYKFVWRYAASSARPGSLLINDTVASGVTFENTTEWTTWEITSVTAYAKQGDAKISLEATNSDGLPNIDYMKIISIETEYEVTYIECDSLPQVEEEENAIYELKNSTRSYVIFPVPAQNYINVAFKNENETIEKAAIYSIDGRKVTEITNIDSNTARIELGKIQNGIYLIQVFTNTGTYTGKFNINK